MLPSTLYWLLATVYSLNYRGHRHLAEPDLAVVALEHDRTGLSFVGIKRASGDSIYDAVVLNRLAVQHRRDSIADDDRIDGLPFARRQARIHKRFHPAINRHVAVDVGRFAVIVQYLQLIPAAQIQSAVAVLSQLVFSVDFEIFESLY